MRWTISSTVDHVPDDAVGEAAAEAVAGILEGSTVDLVYSPLDGPPPELRKGPATASSTGAGPPGWQLTVTVELGGRIAPLVTPEDVSLLEMLDALPDAAIRAAERLRPIRADASAPLAPPMRRALRDTVVIEALADQQSDHDSRPAVSRLISEILEYLIELSGLRVEAHELTHGVLVTDALSDEPRLQFQYPIDLRPVKRSPLLFDGQRSLLVVDRSGRARTELQRHRLNRLLPGSRSLAAANDAFIDSGSLVAEATRRVGGIGFFLRADRSIWAFVNGQPLVVRRGEHWTAFPLELAAAITHVIGGGPAADIAVEAALVVSAQQRGAILAIVDSTAAIEGIVPLKDRYDLRNEVDPSAMQAETRLHHLIDAEPVDVSTLARLATLDGATVLDRDANLIAYGAIVTSADSQHEGARTAAAKTLSEASAVVLKVSQDGDITVFHRGTEVATLLGAGGT